MPPLPEPQSEPADTGSTLLPQPESIAAIHPGSGVALSYLAKMSGTGSSFGQADYVAISPLAISALIFGLLSFGSLVFTLFLAASAAGLVLGLLAILKIRQSNGTQSGTILAILGILLSLVVGGGVLARTVGAWSQEREAIRKCGEVIARFGEEVKAGRYDYAYDNLTTEAFHSKFDRTLFRKTLQEFQAYKEVGPLEWYRLNDLPIIFDPIVDSEAKQGKTFALAKFSHQPESREAFILNNVEGTWKIDSLPRFFKPKKKGRGKEES